MASSLVRCICPPSWRHERREKQRFRATRVRCSGKVKPWLALPPLISEGGDEIVYKMYSLGEKRTVCLKQERDVIPIPRNLVGSSHGWLALWDYNDESLLLSNPISGRQMKLPPLGRGWKQHIKRPPPGEAVGRLLLSSSPEEDGCRAVLVSRGAFCAPRVSRAWARVDYDGDEIISLVPHGDFAYCSSRGIFSSITPSEFGVDSDGCVCVYESEPNFGYTHQIDDWKDLDVERIETTWFWRYKGGVCPRLLLSNTNQKLRLVYADDHFNLPLVIVHLTVQSPTYKTAGFVVVQIEKYGDECKEGGIKIVEDLKGLAIFVGESQTFAIPGDGIVKPNSIYFTNKSCCACFDVGIFDYENKTIAPLCDDYEFLHDVEGSRADELMWFTPNANPNPNPKPPIFRMRPSKVVVSSPWLMLPPAFDDMLYRFYNPAKDEIIPIPIKKKKKRQSRPPKLKLVGSSHGWLALFEERSNRVFLSNPLSGGHVELPPINIGVGVSRLVLSCSPEEDECRALMSFGPKDRLAFCAPHAHAPEWIPIGDLYGEPQLYSPYDGEKEDQERNYADFVYSSRHGLFFCITEFNSEVEAWDLRDPLSPRLEWMIPITRTLGCHDSMAQFSEDLRLSHPQPRSLFYLLDQHFHPKYLVSFSDHLFVLVRQVAPSLLPGRRGSPPLPWGPRYPYKTIGFTAYRIDPRTRRLRWEEMSRFALEGLAIFVGINHSFALPAADFPCFKPDSIYFTNDDRRSFTKWVAPTGFAGHDNGVYDYTNHIISPSYYPPQYQNMTRIVPPLTWFTPSFPSYN